MRTPKWSVAFTILLGVSISVGSILGANMLAQAQAQVDAGAVKAVAVLSPTEGSSAKGVVTFTKVDGGVRIEAEVSGLEPNKEHGFHVHQYGDLTSADGMAAGGHFNPQGKDHAGPHKPERHVGDFGNIKADADGNAKYDRVDELVSLDMANKNCVIGRGVIVHAGTDDLTTQPTGDAGARIAQGVVGVANPE